jgi:hypothetical protein
MLYAPVARGKSISDVVWINDLEVEGIPESTIITVAPLLSCLPNVPLLVSISHSKTALCPYYSPYRYDSTPSTFPSAWVLAFALFRKLCACRASHDQGFGTEKVGGDLGLVSGPVLDGSWFSLKVGVYKDDETNNSRDKKGATYHVDDACGCVPSLAETLILSSVQLLNRNIARLLRDVEGHDHERQAAKPAYPCRQKHA